MVARDAEDLRAYARKLRGYSARELEDIYFHINILCQPLRYRLVLREMEARHMAVQPEPPPRPVPDLRAWLQCRPMLRAHPTLRGCALSLLVFAATTGATLALLMPIWLFAIPLQFVGVQTALVYFSCVPVPPILGAAVGARLGGRGAYGVFVLLGVVTALAVFDATGAPAAIVRMLVQPQGVGGGGFGF